MIKWELRVIKIFLVKVVLKICTEIFIIDSVLKANPLTYKIKDLNGEKIIGSFDEK